MLGQHKITLDTPALVLDKQKLISNIKTMQAYADQHGKAVRPHAKTHKCSQIAKLQRQYGSIGICTTKVSEALVLAEKGISGILITSPVVTAQKLNRLASILKMKADTMVVSDSADNLKALNQLAKEHSIKGIGVIIDIDAGIGRTGVDVDQTVDLAIQAHKLTFLELKGIQCYAGHIQHITGADEREKVSQSILQVAGAIKAEIERKTGLKNLIQTGSGTGTYEMDCNIDSVTEIQPGSYTVMDKEYFDVAYTQAHFAPAMTMLSSVISANHDTHVTVDAGLKALYQTATLPKVVHPEGLKYDWAGFGDEHGKIMGKRLPKCGEVIELIVAHCDPTINLFDKIYITENDIVVDIWDIDLRGMCQ
ncbi:MAG: DSD1 family PLP-dependent enzyme [Francisellaceae bacterium]